MISIRQTEAFSRWMRKLRDVQGRAVLARRIERLVVGNLGDYKAVGDGVFELRVAFGPGYRVYFTFRGSEVIVLLCGGDKGSQRRDIAAARALTRQLE